MRCNHGNSVSRYDTHLGPEVHAVEDALSAAADHLGFAGTGEATANTSAAPHTDAPGDASHVEWPTMFGLSLDGHGVTFNFVVNDILMALYFGLATKEIAEAFQVGTNEMSFRRRWGCAQGCTLAGHRVPFRPLPVCSWAGTWQS
jgi:hypothetical protein